MRFDNIEKLGNNGCNSLEEYGSGDPAKVIRKFFQLDTGLKFPIINFFVIRVKYCIYTFFLEEFKVLVKVPGIRLKIFLTKMLTTRSSPRFFPSFTRDRWPSWRNPMVGTNAIVLNWRRILSERACIIFVVVIISMKFTSQT